MRNSIPSEIRLIDHEGDGFADRMYVGDMRGQLWRFDIKQDNGGPGDFATGGVIANIGGTDAASNRRFYYPPSVSMSTSMDYYNIAIGSGYRAHPLNTTIHDRFYVIRDKNVSGPARDTTGNPVYTAITESNLYDATDNLIQSPTAATAATAASNLAGKQGYFIKLKRTDGNYEGEKVLAQGLTIGNMVIFTTFTPISSTSASACAPSQGMGKVYIINVEDGGAATDADGDGVMERSDRTDILVRAGIPPRPTTIITTDGTAIIIGTEVPDGMPRISLTPVKERWQRN
jgi:type IV pilus assembly protein PilY1